MQKPYSVKFCGNGSVPACAASIWQALDEAGSELAAAQGDPNPAAWRASATAERIQFRALAPTCPGPVTCSMRWANRPTYQQAQSYTAHR